LHPRIPSAADLMWIAAEFGDPVANAMLAHSRRIEADPSLRANTFFRPFSNACHGGQLAMEKYLRAHGADLKWPAPWSHETPLNVAEMAGHSDVVVWLVANRAANGKKSA
jgi:hypothetical protein